MQAHHRLDLGVRVVSADDHRVVGEERVDPARRVEHPHELPVGLRDRLDLRVRAVLVRPGVVVGQREQQEVEQVLAHEELADAARVLVAHPRQAELGAARRAAAGEDVGVEELPGAEDGMAEQRARRTGQHRVARDLVVRGGGRGT
ncbi:MAG: hypothetical protein R2736_00760 [Solirubrobacterales bacterium]